MHEIGIEEIAFSTSEYFLDLEDLATINNVDPEKYLKGIGQNQFSCAPIDEDIITLGVRAAKQILTDENVKDIKFLLFATESSFDNSKSAGMYLHEFLNLPKNCRVIELKQACYSATSAIQIAKNYVQIHPNEKCLVIASDIAKYEPKTSGEPTQGAAASAMIISSNPKVLYFENFSGICTKNIFDFWKPEYLTYPIVDGKLSTFAYLGCLKSAWEEFSASSKISYNDFFRICYHTPFAKMAEKAHIILQRINTENREININDQLIFNKTIGNTYTSSLYLSLFSLLANDQADLSGKRVGLFSYGSGSTSEFFSCIISNEYQNAIKKTANNFKQKILNRKKISYEKYLFFNTFKLENNFKLNKYTNDSIRLKGIFNHKREYELLD